MTLAMIGHPDATHELRSQADRLVAANMLPMARFVDGIATMLESDVGPLRAAVDAWIDAGLRDPEALFIHGLFLAGGGDHGRGLERMNQSVQSGYLPHDTVRRHRWLDPLRHGDDFTALAETMRVRHEQAAAAFFRCEPLPPTPPGDPARGQIFSYHVDQLHPPDWARDAIIYQVFVDRFDPGDGRSWLQPAKLGGFFGGTLWGS